MKPPEVRVDELKPSEVSVNELNEQEELSDTNLDLDELSELSETGAVVDRAGPDVVRPKHDDRSDFSFQPKISAKPKIRIHSFFLMGKP